MQHHLVDTGHGSTEPGHRRIRFHGFSSDKPLERPALWAGLPPADTTIVPFSCRGRYRGRPPGTRRLRDPTSWRQGLHEQAAGHRINQLREIYGEDPHDPQARFKSARQAGSDQPITVRAEGADSTRMRVRAGAERTSPSSW
ncbi:hypothetical protein GCM10011374_34530 [Kocuria dechangensis]|uniref:Uncharacterized protein n=1 Tax=Kocuria dechangensis TaxID=1176249 RepID=A0A917H5N7_9MICC|nr:hypothetical protein GCM10011374_34530 [Kocuria dechangensis]